MNKNILIKTFLNQNDPYQVCFDTLNKKIWVDRKTLETLSNKNRISLSRAISCLIIDGLINQRKNIKKVITSKNSKTFLYDKVVLKEILPQNKYEEIDQFEQEILEEYNKRYSKIYIKNGLIEINRYLVNNILDIKLDINDMSEICNANINDILKIDKKTSYDIYDFINIVFKLENDTTKEIRNSLSNILIKCIVDGYYINNDLCINDKNKIINITKIADNIISKKELDDDEKRKYYNTISYNDELYESSSFINELILSAKEEIIIISKFMDDDIFNILSNASKKITLYSSKNSIVTKYNLSLFRQNHEIELCKKYASNNTYIIIDDDIYFFDVSIINILKSNSICIKHNISKHDLFKKLKI